MPLFTVNDLVDRAASISDMHDGFVSPKEWLAWYNQERRALEFTRARYGAAALNIAITKRTIGTFVGDVTALNSLPLAVLGVWELLPSNRLRQLRIVPFIDNTNQFSALSPDFDFVSPISGPAQIVSVLQRVSAGNESTEFTFFPAPTSGTYLIATIPAPPVATSLTSNDALPMGLEERIVLGMARRALIKEESDIRAVTELIKEADQLVEEYSWGLVTAQGNKMRNVDHLQRGWWDDITATNPESWLWL